MRPRTKGNPVSSSRSVNYRRRKRALSPLYPPVSSECSMRGSRGAGGGRLSPTCPQRAVILQCHTVVLSQYCGIETHGRVHEGGARGPWSSVQSEGQMGPRQERRREKMGETSMCLCFHKNRIPNGASCGSWCVLQKLTL